jgi:lipopolysaccharide biosynthesis protein
LLRTRIIAKACADLGQIRESARISMPKLKFAFPRAYRLRPIARRQGDDLPISLLQIGASNQGVLVPYSPKLDYVVSSASGFLPIKSPDFRVETLGALPSLWARLRLAFFFKKNKYLKYEQFSVFSAGEKAERKRFTRYQRDTMNIGVGIDSDLVAKHPELLYGWPAVLGPAPQVTDRSASVQMAVVAHIYYEDTWPDIAGALMGLTVPFDLIVTTVASRERLIDEIRRRYPRAKIEIVENRGRDIGPFLVLLEGGQLDGYRYICKIHGKKSIDGGRKTYLGDMWRRRLLFDLLGAPGAARAAIEMFEQDPSIGMIGPRAFRLPNDRYPANLSWADNRPTTLRIAERMGVLADKFQLDFFGGTMFWVRPEALKPLRDLRLSADMPAESGLVDGDLPHALERVLPSSVLVAGYKLADSDGYEVRQGPQGTSGIVNSAGAVPPAASVRA